MAGLERNNTVGIAANVAVSPETLVGRVVSVK